MKRRVLPLFISLALTLVSGISFGQVYILNEDFATAAQTIPPSGWTNTMVSGQTTDLWHFDNPGTRPVNLPVTSPFAIFDAGYYSPGGGSEEALLTSPSFDASIGTNCLLIFDHYISCGTGDTAKIEAYNGTVWTTVQSYTVTSSSNPVHECVDLTSVCAGKTNAKIRFRWKGTGQGYWLIDNIHIYAPISLDAGISFIDQPAMPFQPGVRTVAATITNFGYLTLNSVSVHWSVNGMAQVPFSWNGTIEKGNSQSSVAIGTFPFNSGTTYQIKAWTENPNGIPDLFHLNDSTIKSVRAGLCGTFTVGGSNPDFTNLTEVIDYFNIAGVTCPVLLRIRNGNYTDQLDINDIQGLSQTNTITFESENGDSSLVSISGTSSYGLVFNNVSNVCFRKVGISTGIKFLNGANRISIRNCRIGRNGGDYLVGILQGSHHLELANNLIPGAAYWGVTMEPSIHHIAITGNTIKGCFYGGINGGGNLNNVVIRNNTLTDFNYPFFSGISVSGDSIGIYHNMISKAGTGISLSGNGPDWIGYNRIDSVENSGIDFSSSNTTVFNNYITLRNISGGGISANNPANSTVAFNNINGLSFNADSRAFYLSGGINLSVTNNIFSNSGAGYAVYIDGEMNPGVVMDYNDYYSSANKIGSCQNIIYSTFSAWKSATGKENHGVDAFPRFFSSNILKPNHILLDNSGIPVPGIIYDIDSILRNPVTPDIGASEINSCAPDAGIERITAPADSLVAGVQPVKVILINQGSVLLSSVKIHWAVNNIEIGSYNWSGSLSPGQSEEVTVGTYNFLSIYSYQIKAWPTAPNGLPDCNSHNDTAQSMTFYPKLCGAYTIGGSNPDFNSFTQVSIFLAHGGISCPVTFNIRDGIYPDNDRLQLGPIPGSSEINTITFQSESNDSSKVYLTAGSSLTVNKSSYVTFKGIHFNGEVTVNKSKHITFSHCWISTSHMNFSIGSDYVSVINCYISVWCNHWRALIIGGNHNHLAGNIFDGGIYGGGNHLVIEKNSAWLIQVEGDTIDILSNRVLLTEWNACVTLGFNSAITVSGNHFRILNNRIALRSNDRRMTGLSGTVTASIIGNNYITGGGLFPIDGMNINGINTTVCFNNIHLKNPFPDTKAIMIFGASGLIIRNNILSNPGGGYCAFLSGVSPDSLSMDYNDYYSLSGKIGSLNDTIYSSLDLWKTRTGGEAHGKSVNPFYASDSVLQPNNIALDNSGMAMAGLEYDIDSVLRTPGSPDIGAKEFSLCANDAGINGFSSPATLFSPGNQDLRVMLQNHGTLPLTSVQIHYTFNGVVQPVYNWTGNLASGQSTEVILGNSIFGAHLYRLKAWTEFPNSSTDCNHFNDTCVTEKRYPLLCGAYTIGGSDPNFLNFREAADVLNNTVISCPVVFKVRTGNYPERIEITKVNGISPQNTVTFESETGNNTDVVLSYPSTGDYLACSMSLINVSYFKIKNMTIQSIFSTYLLRNAALLLQNSASDTIENCRFIKGSSWNTPDGIFAGNCPEVVIRSNLFDISGLSVGGSDKAVISGNSCINGASISAGDNNRSVIKENHILNASTGITVNNETNDTISIEDNRIDNVDNGITVSSTKNHRTSVSILRNSITSVKNYGISLEAGQDSEPMEGTITNNMVHTTGTGVSTGINLKKVAGLSVLFNSVNSMTQNFQCSSFAVSNSSNLQVKNNIFSNTGNGFSVVLDQLPLSSLFDFDNYHNSGNRVGSLAGTVYQTLPVWKTAIGGEANSKNFFPYFASDTSFHIYQRNLNGPAIPVDGVNTDLEGDVRNTTAPDIGADEFKVDFGISDIVNPTLVCAHSPGEHITIRMKQCGDIPFYNQMVAYSIDNALPVVDTIMGWMFHDSVFTFTQTVNISAQGTYTIKCWMVGNWDDDVSNDTISVLRYVYPEPTGDFTWMKNCTGQDVVFMATGTVASPYSIGSYQWMFGDGTTGTGQTVAHQFPGTGTYEVKLHIFSNMGCFTEVIHNVTIKAGPVAQFSSLTGNCQGSSMFFDDNSYTPSGTLVRWKWNFGDGTSATILAPANPDITHIYTNYGTYQVVLTTFTADSCSDSDTVNVIIGIAPIAEFSASSPACHGTPVTFTDASNTNSGSPVNSWLWNFGDPVSGINNTSVMQNPAHFFTSAGSYTVTLITGNGTCTDTISRSVSVGSIPVPNVSGDSSACTGSSGILYSTQTGMSNYVWTISPGGTITSGGTSTSSTATVTWNTPGTQWIRVNYTNGSGCTAVTPFQYDVTVNALPNPGITGTATVCAGAAGVIYTTQPGMSNYNWTISPGGTINSGGTSISSTATVTWNTPGTQWIRVNYTNGSGCTAVTPFQYDVTVNALPNPGITGTATVCAGAAGVIYTTQPGMSNYFWTISPGGTITSGGTSTSSTATVTWNMPGAQWIRVNYTNGSGCTAITPVQYDVMVNALPIPAINGPSSACAISTGNIYTTDPGMSNYQWNVSAGGVLTSGSGTDSITVTWNMTGPQDVSVNFTNSSGCTATSPSIFNVSVGDMPDPTITGNTSLCVNSGFYYYSTEPGMTNYQWIISPGGAITLGAGTSQIQVVWNVPGAQMVSVNYSNASGCTGITPAQLNVTVNPLPSQAGSINGTDTVCAGQQGVVYTVAPVQNAMTYLWSLPAGASIASGFGTNSITVDFSPAATSGNIIVTANNLCGNGASSPPLFITVRPILTAPGPINGSDHVCKPAYGLVYNINPMPGATSYNWSVPLGVNIIAGNGTNSITTDFPLNSCSGNVTASGINECGSGAITTLPVMVHETPPTPTVMLSGDTLVSSTTLGNQWFVNEHLIPGATGQKYLPSASGDYYDQINLENCLSDTSNHIYVVLATVEEQISEGFIIFPVPNEGIFQAHISGSTNDHCRISVYNDLGIKIYERLNVDVPGQKLITIDISSVPAGVYTVIANVDRTAFVKKIIILNHP